MLTAGAVGWFLGGSYAPGGMQTSQSQNAETFPYLSDTEYCSVKT